MKTVTLLLVLCTSIVHAQETSSVAAVVGDHEITIARVERHLEKTLGSEEFDLEIRNRLLGESLEHLIRRHVVLQAVKKDGITVGKGELRMEVEKLRDRLKEIDLEMDEYLVSRKLKQSEMEYEFVWRMAWQKYLKKHLTERQLEKYFEKHRRQFDGTEMQVAHLLFSSLKESSKDLSERAERVKGEVERGEIEWKQAVKKYSDAKSSADQSGEVGWITYDGPMPHSFCQAAMKLNVDEISAPVQTLFGIHLIKCLQIRPGKLGPKDAAEQVREAAARYLFESLSTKGRGAITVEYKVDWPKPETTNQR